MSPEQLIDLLDSCADDTAGLPYEQTFRDAAQAARAQAAEIARLRAEAERLEGMVEEAGKALESIANREYGYDANHTERCINCGDEALSFIDSDQWKFDDHGDMRCRECGADRSMVGYEVDGRSDFVLTAKAALARLEGGAK